MGNVSLKQEACARQLHSSKPKNINISLPDSDSFGGIFQAMSFSLTFTSSQWCLFWRLLNVGCMLADQVLDSVSYPMQETKPDTALLWNRLSDQLAASLKKDEVCVTQKKELQTR